MLAVKRKRIRRDAIIHVAYCARCTKLTVPGVPTLQCGWQSLFKLLTQLHYEIKN